MRRRTRPWAYLGACLAVLLIAGLFAFRVAHAGAVAQPRNPDTLYADLADLRTPDALRLAIDHFRAVLQADPNDVPAYAGLVDALAAQDRYRSTGWSRRNEPQVRDALQQLQRLHCALAPCLTARAIDLLTYHWRRRAQITSLLTQAVTADPNYGPAHQWYSDALFEEGDLSRAISQMERARALEPLSAVVTLGLAQELFDARRYAAALEAVRSVAILDPKLGPAYEIAGLCEVQLGRSDAAIHDFRTGAIFDRSGEAQMDLAYVYATSGRAAQADALLRREPSAPAFEAALVDYALGRDAAARRRIAAMLRATPNLPAAIRLDPRYVALVRLLPSAVRRN